MPPFLVARPQPAGGCTGAASSQGSSFGREVGGETEAKGPLLSGVSYTRWAGSVSPLTGSAPGAAPGMGPTRQHCLCLTEVGARPSLCFQGPCPVTSAQVLLFRAGLGVSCCSCVPSAWLRVGPCKCLLTRGMDQKPASQ